MSRFDGVRCPTCLGELLRKEFQPLAGWDAYKCRDLACSTVFAIYAKSLEGSTFERATA
jgi:hypothetical protein